MSIHHGRYGLLDTNFINEEREQIINTALKNVSKGNEAVIISDYNILTAMFITIFHLDPRLCIWVDTQPGSGKYTNMLMSSMNMMDEVLNSSKVYKGQKGSEPALIVLFTYKVKYNGGFPDNALNLGPCNIGDPIKSGDIKDVELCLTMYDNQRKRKHVAYERINSVIRIEIDEEETVKCSTHCSIGNHFDEETVKSSLRRMCEEIHTQYHLDRSDIDRFFDKESMYRPLVMTNDVGYVKAWYVSQLCTYLHTMFTHDHFLVPNKLPSENWRGQSLSLFDPTCMTFDSDKIVIDDKMKGLDAVLEGIYFCDNLPIRMENKLVGIGGELWPVVVMDGIGARNMSGEKVVKQYGFNLEGLTDFVDLESYY